MTSQDLVTAARRFVNAVEAHNDVNEIHAALALLYAVALSLEYQRSESSEFEFPHISHEQWVACHRDMQLLTEKYFYHAVLHNLFDMTKEPEYGLGDLGDDLADIWRELKPGLMHIDAGKSINDVVWHWQTMFSHWGDHAAYAISTLHRLLYDDEP